MDSVKIRVNLCLSVVKFLTQIGVLPSQPDYFTFDPLGRCFQYAERLEMGKHSVCRAARIEHEYAINGLVANLVRMSKNYTTHVVRFKLFQHPFG